MSRRGRSLAFLLAAVLAAAAAAALADGYGSRVAQGYGVLRPVLVAGSDLRAGRPIGARAAQTLEVRRVPARFVPPGALESPAQAVGLVPAATIPAGGYVLAVQLRPPRRDPAGASLGRGRHPVEIAVTGAGALTLGGAEPAGGRVDVVVTTEPQSGGAGRTYVAAASVPLLALVPGPEGSEGDAASATLGLTRPQALRLIAAESFARRVTILPVG